VISIVMAVASVTGCASGGTSAGSGNGTAASCDAPGVTASTIKVGLIYPDTGVFASAFEPARSAVQARIGLANATGGINGRQIELVWGDDVGTPSVNGRVAEEMVEKQGVFGFLELSTAVTGSAAYLDSKHVPVVGLTAESVWNDHDNMFAFSYLFAEGTAVSTFGQYAKAQGGTRAVLIDDRSSASSSQFADQMEASLTSQEIKVVKEVPFLTGQGIASYAAQQIVASNADVIVGTVAMSSLADILTDVRALGGHPTVVLSPTGYSPELLHDYGSALAGLSIYLNYTPFEAKSQGITNYENAMAQYAPELHEPDQEVAVASYIDADLFLKGLEVAGSCPTRESYIKNLRAVKNYDGGGLVPGTIDLSDNRGKPSTCYAFVRVNPTATAFEVVKRPDGSTQWCGQRLTATALGNGG
jgi:ABC-type branched-subunit amino acid transport system substrate-binding protein